jgi:hypothetical protein
MNKIIGRLWLLYFSLIILFTFQYQNLKILLLIVIFINSIIFSRLYFSKFTLYWYILYLVFNIIFLILGILNNGIIILRFYLLSEIISLFTYFFLFNIVILKKKIYLEGLEKIYKIGFGITIGIIFIYYFDYNHSFKVLNKFLQIIEKIIEVKKIYRPGQYNKITASIPMLATMSFIIPYITTDLFQRKKLEYIKITILNIFILLLIIFSMRKALIVIYIISLLINLFIFYLYNKKMFFKSIFKLISLNMILLFFFFMLNKYYNFIDFDNTIEYIKKSFDYTRKNFDFAGVSERKIQFKYLIKAWLNDIGTFLIGQGTGSNVEIVRSEIPGQYELTYIAMLFQRGIVGIIYYFGLIYSIYYKYYTLIKQNYIKEKEKKIIFKYGNGFLGILMYNFMNPTLISFEFIWIVFINLYVIEIVEGEKK